MENKTKRVFWGFFSLDYKAMGEYLEEMAQKGWMLEKVGQFTAKFRAIEPRKLKFCVDIFKKGGEFAPEDNEESREYRRLCQESGWTFITSQEYLQFFYASEDSDPVTLQTDEEIEQKIVESTLLKRELISILLFLLVGIFALNVSFPVRYSNLLSFGGVTATFLFPVLFVVAVIPALYSIIRMINARRRIKNGLTIKTPTLKNARRRIIAFSGSIWVIVSIFVISFIADAFFTPDDVLLAAIGPTTGIAVGTLIRYLVKKNKIKEGNGVLFAVIAIFAVIFFMPKATSLIAEKNVDSVPEGYPIVTLEEIWGDSGNEDSIAREFKRSGSPVTPKYYTYWEQGTINGTERYMDIKFYYTINPYFSEIIFNGKIDRLKKGFKWHGMTILNRNVVTDDEMKSLWGADNLALTEERDELIVRKGNTVLHLVGDIDFNDEQTRELMLERFFSDVQLKN